jgi:hypothetical protein
MPVEQPMLGSPDLVAHTGFILAEDEALKKYLSGITVPTRPGAAETTEVGVWFRFPEGERQISYPFITLDLLSVEPAYDLFTSVFQEPLAGLYQPSVSPSLPVSGEDGLTTYSIPNFLPFRLIYQVMVHCRSSLHDRYLLSLFMTDVVQPRPFWLAVDADMTWRRVERVGFAQADIPETTESGTKRIFRKVHTLSMLAEIPQAAFVQSYMVLRVLLAVTDREMMDQYYNAILKNQPDPLGTFTQTEREEQGEYFHSWHEGRIVTEAGAPPPG